jgi:preprotein translocase subunit SecY
MSATLKKIFSIPELREKIIYTLLLLCVCRIGAYIPVPGINGEEVVKSFQYMTRGSQNLFQLMDIFTGGAFAQMTIVALGVMPYISASIIMQLLMAVIPSLQREMKENSDQGRRRMGKWTRIFTLFIAVLQSGLYAKQAMFFHMSSSGVIYDSIYQVQAFGFPWLFFLLVIATMTTGSLFLMWVGEQITAKGIGNGMSLIITLGIISSLPSTVGSIVKQLNLDSQEMGQLSFSSLVVLAGLFVSIIAGTISIIQSTRKIPLQYATRRGSNFEGEGAAASTAHIPLKINYAGVIPVIFASSFLMFPATIAQFLGAQGFLGKIATFLSPGNWVYGILYVSLIIGFTYLWTAMSFHPDQIASDMKKNGAFIPGIRQGKPTQDYLENCMSRLTFVGAIFLALIAVLPTLVGRLLGVDQTISHFFGGTSLLILIGVVLDTSKQIDSHLLMERYDGFMSRRKGKI